MITQTIDYHDGSTILEGYLAYHDTGTPKPAVLVSHDWSGRRELACKGAERVADMGYVGFALDMYGKGAERVADMGYVGFALDMYGKGIFGAKPT